jgi:putative PIG3 family NAD(P)H quinone oxidoreductase
MRALVIDEPGENARLRIGEVDAPPLGPHDLRIGVAPAAVNRGDLLQVRGLYPPPPGASDVLGLECAGRVAEVGPLVSGWSVGDRAMALLPGGGYAEEAVVHAGSAMRVPERFSDAQAAAFPEVYLTVFLNVFQLGGLPDRGTALVHGGGGGIGTAATQLVGAAGGRIAVTAGTDEKCRRCEALGADLAVNYREADFAEAVKEWTGGQGVDVVLDSIGAPYLERNLASLKVGGALVLIGLMGGARAEINLGGLLMKRQRIVGSTLRARPVEEKAGIVAGLLEQFGDALRGGALTPVVHATFPLAEAAEAHRVMLASEHFGKLVLTVDAS